MTCPTTHQDTCFLMSQIMSLPVISMIWSKFFCILRQLGSWCLLKKREVYQNYGTHRWWQELQSPYGAGRTQCGNKHSDLWAHTYEYAWVSRGCDVQLSTCQHWVAALDCSNWSLGEYVYPTPRPLWISITIFLTWVHCVLNSFQNPNPILSQHSWLK